MRVSTNIIWNAAGIILPLAVGVVVAPMIVGKLGVDRFGVLSLVWMMIGYFNIFDFGLGRTLTKMVADRIGTPAESEIPSIVSTTVGFVTVVGVVLGLVVVLASHVIAVKILRVPLDQIADTGTAVACLAASLPFVLIGTALFGLFEAYQSFTLISAVRLPVGVLMFAAPLAVLPFSHRLSVITAVLGGLRILTALVLGRLSLRLVPTLRRRFFVFHRRLLRPMLAYGGWLTVSNVVGPAMVYFDRFMIAAVLGSQAIAYYTVPYDVLTRLWVFPSAIQGVLFPAFAAMRSHDITRIAPTFQRSFQTTVVLMLPPLLAVQLLAAEGLGLWMGPNFALHSSTVAAILMVGVFVNSAARTPWVFVQSAGRADWTATVHLVELPFYVATLWWLLHRYGIIGAAYAWTARIAADTVAFYVLSTKIEKALRQNLLRDLFALSVICIVACVLGLTVTNLISRLVITAVGSLICGLLLVEQMKSSLFGGRTRAGVRMGP